MVGSSGRKIVVEFIGDASSLTRAGAQGEAALTGFAGKAQATGKIAGKVLAGGLLLAGAAAISATKAAAEDEAAQVQLAQQLRQAAGATDEQVASTEAWITAQGEATGITDDVLRPALARLATATGDVGEAQRLAALAMDVSVGASKDYSQVAEALAKAQNGNIGALGRLGIATKDASGHTKTLAQIQQDLADKYNGAASKAAETAAGKQKILTTRFQELQEQIGANLLPIMVKLSEAGLKVVDWISRNTTTAAAFIGVLGTLLAITTAVGYAAKVASAIQMIWAAGTAVVTAAQWLLNAALTANPVGLLIVAIAALVAGLIIAYKHSETFRNIVNAAFGAIKTVVTTVVEFITGFIRDHWKLMIALILGPMGIIIGQVITHWDKIKLVFQIAVGIVKSIVTTAFNAIRDFFHDSVAGWKTIINNAWDAIKEAFQKAKDTLATIAGNIKDAVGTAFDKITETVQGVIDKVQSLISWIEDLINKIQSIPGIPGSGRVAAKSGGKGAVGGTKDAIASAAGVVGAVGVATGVLGRGSAGGAEAAPIVVHMNFGLVGDPVAAAREFVKALRQLERTTGRKLLVSNA